MICAIFEIKQYNHIMGIKATVAFISMLLEY